MQQSELLFRPYAESFAINKSCVMQSKALDRSVRTAPTMKLLSKFHSILPLFLSAHVEYCMIFYKLLTNVQKTLLYQKPEGSQQTFYKSLRRGLRYSPVENLKYSVCLLSFYLEVYQATFALLEKMLYLKLLFIAIAFKDSAAI